MKQEQSFYRFGFNNKCRCKEKFLIPEEFKRIKKRKKKIPVHVISYPILSNSKTFYREYDKKLSFTAKMILNSLKHKYIYYAMDDIFYFFKSRPLERDNLLSLLCSPIISLQNTFSVDFFDIWIDEICITENAKVNKFLANTNQNLEPSSFIRITFSYKVKLPTKKPDYLW